MQHNTLEFTVTIWNNQVMNAGAVTQYFCVHAVTVFQVKQCYFLEMVAVVLILIVSEDGFCYEDWIAIVASQDVG